MEYSEDEINLITLASFDYITYSTQYKLLSHLTSSCPDFEKYCNYLIKKHSESVYNKLKENFFDREYRKKLLEKYSSQDIVCVTYFSDAYPKLLTDIDDPPLVLYCKGNIELLKDECFTVVGSRLTIPQALKGCKSISADLTQKFTVVSGIADGADSSAVEGALPSGRIICFLPFGFDYATHAGNARLIENVERSGLVVSEYTPSTKPLNFMYHERNRLLAGVSVATLVVGAGAKSGAAITANFAFEYGRDVFAFPYSIGVTAGEGCNSLIKKGAYLTENILDIFTVYGLDFKCNNKENNLSDDEKKLLSEIRADGESFVPSVADRLGVAPYALLPALTSLEMKGLIVRLGGNRYAPVG
jgi:DNA processing protein